VSNETVYVRAMFLEHAVLHHPPRRWAKRPPPAGTRGARDQVVPPLRH
jgi:hypothetical protein